jgi:arylsulfatase A-like enzyme
MENFSRRNFLKTGTAATALAAAGIGCGGPQRKSNIIFIMADDLGYGDLGCYGQKVLQTPRLDQFAAEGMQFSQAYAGSTVCAPARSTLMTGQHTGHTRVRGNRGATGTRPSLQPEDVTVAELLQQAGYATGAIGKWALGKDNNTGMPNKKGFDYFFGYLDQGRAHEYYPDYIFENDQKYPLDGKTYTHTLFTERSKQFIRDHQQEPFFLYIPYTIPHTNNELGREVGNGQQVPSDEPYSDRDWPQVEKNFAAMVTLMDKDIGEIMDLLKELGIDEDTLVIFTSDNGPHHEGGHDHTYFDSNGPLRGYKRDLYEGGVREPTMARWPGKIAPGQQSDQVWAFWDFLPTATELAGVDAPANIDGISMLPCFLGKPQKDHEYLYWEFKEGKFKQAVRFGDWKAVWLAFGTTPEIYDLSKDIGEESNIAAQHPDIVGQAEKYRLAARTYSPDYPWPNEE